MRYFRLFPDCHLIRGPARATIYLLTKKKRYHLSKTESTVLDAITGNTDVESVIANHGHEARRLLTMLVKEALGTFFERPVVSEAYSPKSPIGLRGIFEAPPVIQTLHVQITDRCDAKCDFCGDNDLLPWQGCNSCLRWSSGGGRRAAEEDLSKLLDELGDLDVRNVVISGGNPLMEADRLFSLATRLRQAKPGIGIRVACNGGGLDRNIGQQIKTLGIDMSFSVFGTTPDEYGAITGDPELYSQLQNALAVCRELDIKYSITVVVAPSSRERGEELRRFGLSLGGSQELSFTELLPRKDNRVKPRFGGGLPFAGHGATGSSPTGPRKLANVGTTEFFRRGKYNFCLNGRIAIALDGSVLPCPVWPKPVTSIASGKGVRPAFRVFDPESVLPYWEASKAKIPGCQSCENQHSCADCAILEWETYRDVAERRRFCDYVPELGVWEDAGISRNLDSESITYPQQSRDADGVGLPNGGAREGGSTEDEEN